MIDASTPPGLDDGTTELDPTRLFDALRAERRQCVLEFLVPEGRVSLDRVTARVARREGANDERVKISLVHAHLPKLAEAGLVAYDRAARSLELTAAPADLAPYLDLVADRDAASGVD